MNEYDENNVMENEENEDNLVEVIKIYNSNDETESVASNDDSETDSKPGVPVAAVALGVVLGLTVDIVARKAIPAVKKGYGKIKDNIQKRKVVKEMKKKYKKEVVDVEAEDIIDVEESDKK